MKRSWRLLIASVLVALLAACGDRGKGAPPAEKKVVIGNAAQIKAKRLSTHHRAKPLPFGVTHKRFKDGKLLADDAPHPYIPLSGIVHIDPRKSKSLQIAYHEDKLGTLSQEMPASFHISDISIVDEVKVRPGTNQPLVSLTGKKGNSYITALDARGDAISKFMVLSAEPQEDVLVVDDPDIRPMLCLSRSESRFGTVCDYTTSTSFDWGESGNSFSIDNFLKNASTGKKYLMFDTGSIEKLRKLNNSSSDFKKKAIYFENLDVLVVMEDGTSTVERMAVIGRNPLDPAEKDPANDSLFLNALVVGYLATQEEFNTYIDFGGKLTSSPLRDPEEISELVHEIPPDASVKAHLVGMVFSDGSEYTSSKNMAAEQVGYGRYSVNYYKYELRQSNGERLGVDAPECRFKGAIAPGTINLRSFKTQVSTGFGGSFSWNSGKPDIELAIKPFVNVGGQIELDVGAEAVLGCGIVLKEFTGFEVGVPLLGSLQVVIPLEARAEFGVSTAGTYPLVGPRFSMGSKSDIEKPGTVGVKYSSSGGLKTEFDAQSKTSRNHLGFAEGASAGGKPFEGSYAFGVGVGLVMRGEVGFWIAKARIDVELMDALLGVKQSSEYSVDEKNKTFKKYKWDSEGGIGFFTTFKPTISLNTKWVSVSIPVFDLGSPKVFFVEFPLEEEETKDLEPAEVSNKIKFKKCYPKAPPACSIQNEEVFYGQEVDYVNSSQKFSVGVPPLPFYDSNPGFFTYAYIVKDKATGEPVVNEIPMVFPDGVFVGKQGYANKYGVIDVLAEAVYSRTTGVGDGKYCAFTAWGDKKYALMFTCPNINHSALEAL
ncbi:hypothetical protein RAE19_04175 [Rhodoferax sp. TBRC 17660]|uniref:Uncharacterized protein n=1 Tax=Rhodoferax potami TaxID=3068338 RepID=A0ABU3KK68_9BURK|nr:hypothetical protein [Rhodoferax sp. TBRC 17660]MDT7517941.1 hypothetical protein [Rhodoferax sp. TBRC 17660]